MILCALQAELRLLNTLLERYGTHMDIIFLHVVILPVGYLALAEGQEAVVSD